jgi:ribosomal-protein-alanine N-acetyltransferase
VPFSVELLSAVPDPAAAGVLLGAGVPAGWPDEELQGLLDEYEPTLPGFGPWVVIARAEQAVVGSAGFVGPPNDDGELELGYGVVEQSRNRGYATEAAAALVAWALAQPGVERVVARSEASNTASTRVLENLGMTRAGADGQLVRWVTPDPGAGA